MTTSFSLVTGFIKSKLTKESNNEATKQIIKAKKKSVVTSGILFPIRSIVFKKPPVLIGDEFVV